jgi:hypothetical protein
LSTKTTIFPQIATSAKEFLKKHAKKLFWSDDTKAAFSDID